MLQYLDLFKVAFSWGQIFYMNYLSEVWKTMISVLQSFDSIEINRHCKEQPQPTTAIAKNGDCKEQVLPRIVAGIVLLSLLFLSVLLVIFVLLSHGSFPCFSP